MMLLTISQIGPGAFVMLTIIALIAVIIGCMILYNLIHVNKQRIGAVTRSKEREKDLKLKFTIAEDDYKQTIVKLEDSIHQYSKDSELLLGKTAAKNQILINEAKILRSNNDALRQALEEAGIVIEEKMAKIKKLKKDLESPEKPDKKQ